jgi:Heterokaryon incompatibility protein (HET)/Protein kinase domain
MKTWTTRRTFSHDDYTVGWICALPHEMAAAKAMLNDVHVDSPNPSNDHNTYTLGRIRDYDVVLNKGHDPDFKEYYCAKLDSWAGQTPLLWARRDGHDAGMKLLPGKGANLEFRAMLDTTSLDILPAYTALSYTWGDAKNTKITRLNAVEAEITSNLEAALRHLWCENKHNTLWIDAVCINQYDMAERKEQLAIMKDIFDQAESVIAWLGLASENSDQVIDFLEQVGKQAYKHLPSYIHGHGIRHEDLKPNNIFYRHSQIYLTDFSSCTEFEVQKTFDKLASRLDEFLQLASSHRSFLNRNYWYRIWIVQEISIGKKIGQTPLSWAARNGHEAVVKDQKYAEVPTSDTEEREVPINNGVARSITSLWAIWQAQFGGLRGLSHLIRQTGSLSLKSPLALAIWFAGPVLADGPGSRSSDHDHKGQFATEVLHGASYSILVVALASVIGVLAKIAGRKYGPREESVYYHVQLFCSGIICLQAFTNPDATLLEIATYDTLYA